jgi:hypothetical protein
MSDEKEKNITTQHADELEHLTTPDTRYRLIHHTTPVHCTADQ